MIENLIIFYSASFLIIIFTLFALFARNVIYSLLWAVLVFFAGALFFYILGSEYNAIIQAAIYGLAVPVIIALSVMFGGKCISDDNRTTGFAEKTDLGKCISDGCETAGFIPGRGKKVRKLKKLPYIILICAGIFTMAFVYLVLISLVITPDTFNITGLSQVNSFDTIYAFAKGIFINYVWAFELVSLLLTIIIAGLSMFGRKGV